MCSRDAIFWWENVNAGFNRFSRKHVGSLVTDLKEAVKS
jgi:hypothetical protein